MIIRTYQESDEAGVVALWRDVLPGRVAHNDPATSLQKKLEVDRELLFVAEVKGKVAGTAMGGYDGHRGWIYSVAVDPEHRRRGVATALLRKLEAALVERGCLKVNIQVMPGNPGAVKLYEKLGFAVEERVSMGKRLYE